MVRGFDNNGCLILGITRKEIDRLLAGERICCSSAGQPGDPGTHLCIYGGETDEAILERMDKAYPIGTPPPIEDRRGEPGWDQHEP